MRAALLLFPVINHQSGKQILQIHPYIHFLYTRIFLFPYPLFIVHSYALLIFYHVLLHIPGLCLPISWHDSYIPDPLFPYKKSPEWLQGIYTNHNSNDTRLSCLFFHPDYHRRYRNYTGSVPKGSRGLSPPVGIYTLPWRNISNTEANVIYYSQKTKAAFHLLVLNIGEKLKKNDICSSKSRFLWLVMSVHY